MSSSSSNGHVDLAWVSLVQEVARVTPGRETPGKDILADDISWTAGHWWSWQKLQTSPTSQQPLKSGMRTVYRYPWYLWQLFHCSRVSSIPPENMIGIQKDSIADCGLENYNKSLPSKAGGSSIDPTAKRYHCDQENAGLPSKNQLEFGWSHCILSCPIVSVISHYIP